MKNFIIRIAVVLLFLIAATWIINIAPKYELTYKYKDSDLRVILDDVEITRDLRKLPEAAAILGDEVLLSQNTIDILFDKNLYYEEKYDTLITTSENHRANIKLDSRTMEIDGIEQGIKVPAQRQFYYYTRDDRYEEAESLPKNKEIIYIPIKELSEVYNIDIQFTDKLIITNKNSNISKVTVPENQKLELKYLKDDTSKTIATIKPDDYVEIFNFAEFEDFNIVRTSTGELGYAKTSILKDFGLEVVSVATENDNQSSETIRLAWDYINPDNYSIGDKASRSKITNLDIVAPTLLFLQNTDGEVSFRINAVKEYMKWANDAGYKVWVTFKNDGKTLDEVSEFLHDMEHRNKAIKELIDFAKEYKIDGINVDFENMYKDDAESFSQFIRELSIETKKANLILSVCVNIPDGSDNWSLCYQHRLLSEAADYLAVMTYDCRADLSSYASYDWVEENIEKLVVRDHVEPSKILLGIAFDSAYWKITDSGNIRSVYYMNSAKKYLNGSEKWSEKAKQYYSGGEDQKHLIWIEEKTSIKEKLNIIDEYNLSGFACWCLGQETEDVWEVFKK